MGLDSLVPVEAQKCKKMASYSLSHFLLRTALSGLSSDNLHRKKRKERGYIDVRNKTNMFFC